MKIYIIDDDFASVMRLISTMRKGGHQVRIFGNINDGYNEIYDNWNTIDGIILDMKMPGGRTSLGGIDLAMRLASLADVVFRKTDDVQRFVPIAALSHLPEREFVGELRDIYKNLPEECQCRVFSKGGQSDELAESILSWFSSFQEEATQSRVKQIWLHIRRIIIEDR